MKNTLHRIGTEAFLRSLRHGWSTGHVAFLQIGVSTLLAASPGRITTTEELVDWIYGDDPDGGPESAHNNITITVCRLRKQGIPIRTHGNRGYSYQKEDA